MEQDFEDDFEVLEFAISKELEAYDFYMEWARRMVRPEMRSVFEELAGEELEHKEKLELEIMKLGKTVKSDDTAMGTGIGQGEQDMLYGIDMDYKILLMMGISKEEAAFRRYVDLAGLVSEGPSREILLSLAQEEVKHKLRFEKEYNDMLRAK